MFALTDVAEFTSVNLKVQPEQGELIREEYAGVQPGYHMNKRHWITVSMDGTIPDRVIRQWIDNSYQLVVNKLTKSQKQTLQSM